MAKEEQSVPAEILAEVALGGAADAGGLPVDLLGDFLSVLTAAVVVGRPISTRQLRAYQAMGGTAAQQGVALRALLDLYLSSAWRLWRHLPPVKDAASNPEGVVVAGEVMLHAVDDVVASIAEGYQLARRSLVRAQESARREFIDDLLSGTTDVVRLLQRANGFGLDLSGPHAVAVVTAEQPFDDAMPLVARLERAVQGRRGDAQALLASKEGRLVVVFPAPDRAAVAEVTGHLEATLGPRPHARRAVESRRPAVESRRPAVESRRPATAGHWQIGVGRPGIGADGVVSSYREARDALELAGRLDLDTAVVDARDLLVYNVLLRDRGTLADLISSTLKPLLGARGGATPLMETLAEYFAAGGNAALTARALHLSVRAVTYRLDRVRELTGRDPARADDRFALHVAVLGAKLLGWPGQH
ncbi:MAG: CdaR family transcriptional regulator [Pseudonocardiales bacterium]|nr:CdaR family transcriptional regulator [Pseudonocardiales bacterium]